MSKLLPIFFWADKFAVWLIILTSLKYLSSEKPISLTRHLTIDTKTQAELPNPVFRNPGLYLGNFD